MKMNFFGSSEQVIYLFLECNICNCKVRSYPYVNAKHEEEVKSIKW